jgi:hypothetical protein
VSSSCRLISDICVSFIPSINRKFKKHFNSIRLMAIAQTIYAALISILNDYTEEFQKF